MDIKTRRLGSYRFMLTLTLIVGIIGIILQLVLPDFGILVFMLSISSLGGLIGGSSGYEERDRRHLEQSYKIAFEGLLLVVMGFYAVILLTGWLSEGAANFLNDRWPGLLLCAMCIVMALAGFRKKSSESST